MSLVSDIKTLFPDAKPHNGYVRIRCPYHSNGQERHPSMSILTEPRDGLEKGFAKCFSCGWKGTFAEIAADFGLQYVPDDRTVEISEKPLPKEAPVKLQEAVYKKDVPFKFSPYLASRGIPEDVQKLFRIYERKDEQKVYMPVFSRGGKFLYANARSTVGKKFFIQSNAKKTLAGIEEVDFSKPIAIVESQVNMYSLYAAKFAHAVATLGVANISALYDIKKAVGPFLLMLDGDVPGRTAAQKIKDYLGPHRCIDFIFKPNEDVNDLWRACNFDQDKFFDELEARRVKE